MTKHKYEKKFYLVTWVWSPVAPYKPFMTWENHDYSSGYVPHESTDVVKKFQTSLEAAKYANYLKENPENTEISISKNVISLYSEIDIENHDVEIKNNKNLHY